MRASRELRPHRVTRASRRRRFAQPGVHQDRGQPAELRVCLRRLRAEQQGHGPGQPGVRQVAEPVVRVGERVDVDRLAQVGEPEQEGDRARVSPKRPFPAESPSAEEGAPSMRDAMAPPPIERCTIDGADARQCGQGSVASPVAEGRCCRSRSPERATTEKTRNRAGEWTSRSGRDSGDRECEHQHRGDMEAEPGDHGVGGDPRYGEAEDRQRRQEPGGGDGLPRSPRSASSTTPTLPTAGRRLTARRTMATPSEPASFAAWRRHRTILRVDVAGSLIG